MIREPGVRATGLDILRAGRCDGEQQNEDTCGKTTTQDDDANDLLKSNRNECKRRPGTLPIAYGRGGDRKSPLLAGRKTLSTT